MNSVPFFAFLAFFLAVHGVTYADDEDLITPSPDENKFADVANKTWSADDDEDMVIMMPSSDKAVMMLNSGKQKATCYVCTRPCSSIFCCNDGFPQCCSVNGRCGCCR